MKCNELNDSEGCSDLDGRNATRPERHSRFGVPFSSGLVWTESPLMLVIFRKESTVISDERNWDDPSAMVIMVFEQSMARTTLTRRR
jgi:hypothetical protein